MASWVFESQAIAVMRRHVVTKVHRDIDAWFDPRAKRLRLTCRVCNFETKCLLQTLLKMPWLLAMLETGMDDLEEFFRRVPPEDGSSWAHVLDDRWLPEPVPPV